jgi:hypothetical protein
MVALMESGNIYIHDEAEVHNYKPTLTANYFDYNTALKVKK